MLLPENAWMAMILHFWPVYHQVVSHSCSVCNTVFLKNFAKGQGTIHCSLLFSYIFRVYHKLCNFVKYMTHFPIFFYIGQNITSFGSVVNLC